ncbi:MAG: sporulation protein YhbH [Firmicutes bacterium]|nr:sporulation protein YhbH [Bacillota bacterium]
MSLASFSISQEDWTLHRRGQIDQQRHQEKVREAIRKNLADIVSEESIITADGDKIIKIPIRSLEEYRFRFNHNKQTHSGQGNGDSQVGDVLDADLEVGTGTGRKAGEEPGVDYYEAEVTIDELVELVFEDLGLPNLEPKKDPELSTEAVTFNDVRKKGLMNNVDKKRTILETIKRNALSGVPGLHPIKPEDLRYKTWNLTLNPQSSAVVLAMMDTSGSMGTYEKYLARSFYYWMVKFLRTKYHQVEIVFLAHDTQAREVTEEEFFSKGESGGTRCSSVYQLALEIIDERYDLNTHNIYAFHFSDGDNMFSDNQLCMELIGRLLEKCNLVGYGEIRLDNDSEFASYYDPFYSMPVVANPYTLKNSLSEIKNPRLLVETISSKNDIYPTLRAFFRENSASIAV